MVNKVDSLMELGMVILAEIRELKNGIERKQTLRRN